MNENLKLKKYDTKKKAHDLINQFKNILMDENTDFGNEILCTSIAIKNALIVVDEVMSRLPYNSKMGAYWISDDLFFDYWVDVMKELKKYVMI